ncbi:cytochrome c [bacterium]|nr:cytochrome c [bacterium]
MCSSRFLAALTIGFLGVFSLTGAEAADNAKKGKFLYKTSCRLACHEGKTDGAKELNPTSKTKAQWESFFKDGNKKLLKVHGKKELEKVQNEFKEQDYKDILKYLYEHASDSDQPQTCG